MKETDALPPTLPRRGATVRLSQQDLSRISCAVVAFIICVLGFLGYRAVLGFKANHDLLIAKENLHALNKAFYSYAQDWDQRLPPADRWTEQICGFLSSSGQPGGPTASLHGPGDGRTVSYVYNELAAGQSVDPSNPHAVDLSHMVLLIERPGAPPNTHVRIPVQGNPDAEQALLKELSFPHGSDDTDNAKTVIMYADGSQRVMSRRDFR